MRCAGSLCLSLFRPEELGLLLTGKEDLNFYQLENIAKYEGFTPNSKTIRKNFWDIVHNDFSDENKKKLLIFITSSSRAPIDGLGTIEFTISQDKNSKHIPSSHTCFNHLVLPADPHRNSLKKSY
jgi:ubiquitin-protein ligase E3 A